MCHGNLSLNMASLSNTKRRKRKKKHKSKSLSGGLKHYADKQYGKGHYQVPRKLGPIDIGRIRYKGTKYKEADYDFLQEKVHKHARSSSFALRKKARPVPKKKSVSEMGTPNDWKKPSFFDAESERMKQESESLDFLEDIKPMHVRDKTLDQLQDVHLPKGRLDLY